MSTRAIVVLAVVAVVGLVLLKGKLGFVADTAEKPQPTGAPGGGQAPAAASEDLFQTILKTAGAIAGAYQAHAQSAPKSQ